MKTREPGQLKRGKAFHKKIQAEWKRTAEGKISPELTVNLQTGRRGRIDVFVDDGDLDGAVAIVEIKDSDWDRMKESAVRRNIRRQIRQVWKYIETQVFMGEYVASGKKKNVSPGIIFSRKPKSAERFRLIEQMFEDEGIAVVWDDESIEECKARQSGGGA